MPSLAEWSKTNADFANSDVGRALTQKGCAWILDEIESGSWRARVANTNDRVALDVLQRQTPVKLEPLYEQY